MLGLGVGHITILSISHHFSHLSPFLMAGFLPGVLTTPQGTDWQLIGAKVHWVDINSGALSKGKG